MPWSGSTPILPRVPTAWVRDAAGQYSKTPAPGLSGARWAVAARFASTGRCLWSPLTTENLLGAGHSLIICATPVRAPAAQGGAPRGVLAMMLDATAFQTRFRTSLGEREGYGLLFDQDERLLAASGDVAGRLGAVRGLTEIARRLPMLAPVATALTDGRQAARGKALSGPAYNADEVAELRAAVPNLSREEAETWLIQAWAGLADSGRETPTSAAQKELGTDKLLGAPAYATWQAVAGTPWQLVLVSTAREARSDVGYVVQMVLLVTLGLTAAVLLLSLGLLRGWVVVPLKRMAAAMASANEARQAPMLDESAAGEIGLIAHRFNERQRLLGDERQEIETLRRQSTIDTAEKTRAETEAANARERGRLLAEAAEWPLFGLDLAGRIESLNGAAAEHYGLNQESILGRNIDEVIGLVHAQAPGMADGAPELPGTTDESRAASPLGENGVNQGEMGLPADASETGPGIGEALVVSRHLANAGGTLAEVPVQARRPGPGAVAEDTFVSLYPQRDAHGRTSGAVLRLQPAPGFGARRRDGLDDDVDGHGRAGGRASIADTADPVTGLSGRAACERRLRQLSPGRDHAIVKLDVDNLRRLNDQIGRDGGDEALRVVARLVIEAAPSASDVYRFGSDRFVMVLPDTGEASAAEQAESLRAALADARFEAGEHRVALTATFGVAVSPGAQGLTPPAEWLKQTEQAVAIGKRGGRDQVRIFDPADVSSTAEEEARWVERIARGLEQDLFHLTTQAIQPSRDLAHEGTAFEVLVTLEDEEGFWASPALFLPVAERTGQVMAMDQWVVAQTMTRMQAEGANLDRLAFAGINISPVSLGDPSFLDYVVDLLNHSQGVPIRKIAFELSSEMLMEQPRRVREFCDTVRQVGCRIIADVPFAARGPDLAMIRRLPVDLFKLDGQIFPGLADDISEQILAEAMVRAMHQMKKRLIVTNLDTAELAEAWRRLGVDHLQGYALAKPSPVMFMAIR